MQRETVLFVSGLLHTERRRRGTRKGRRALGCFAQAVLIVRWFLDGTRIRQLAADNAISVKTVHRYVRGHRPARRVRPRPAANPDRGETGRAVAREPGRRGDPHRPGQDTRRRRASRPGQEDQRRKLTDDQKTYNKLLRGVRGIGERANALLTVRFKALRRVSLEPYRIGAMTAAALVLLHHENDRTI